MRNYFNVIIIVVFTVIFVGTVIFIRSFILTVGFIALSSSSSQYS